MSPLEWSEDLEDHEYPEFPEDDSSETIECPDCGNQIYEDAEQCPICGSYVISKNSLWHNRPWWWILLGFLGIMATIAGLALASF